MSHLIPASMDDADSCLPVEVGRWYVVRTAPRQEGRAKASLAEIGAKTYLPMAKEWRDPSCPRNEGNKRTVALMPGYLFAELRDAQIYLVKGLEGVLDFIRIDGRPLPMPRSDVRRLYWLAYLESQGGTDYTWSAKPQRWNPKRGQAAKVVTGPMSGFSGKITQLRGKNRMMILGEWFGIRREVEVPVANAEMAA